MSGAINQRESSDYDVVVVVGGIIGLAVAEKLIDSGSSVLLLEREEVASGASGGNAAALAVSDILPLASPGMLKKALKWLVDPLGAFSVVPTDLPWTLPWLIRFLAASRPQSVMRSVEAQADLMDLSRTAMRSMVERLEISHHVRSCGALHLYEDRTVFRDDSENWDLRSEHGIEFSIYKGEELHAFQSNLSPSFTTGVFAPQWQTVSNPRTFCFDILEQLRKRGLEIQHSEVIGITPEPSSVSLTRSEGRRVTGQSVVIAAGPWSNSLAARLGDRIPLTGERGYNMTYPVDALELDRMLVFSQHGFVVTPLVDGLRVGGASEIAGLNRKPNYGRSFAMAKKAKQLLPNLNIEQGEPWMGIRPTTPDTLPVIGFSSGSERVVYACGHGHLGLTQSAATAQLVSELINKTNTSVDMTPFRADRF